MTDFGEDDFFIASLKGVIARINPRVRIVDITHRVPSFDVTAANFILFSCYKYFPSGTIFLAVIDPGVGSSRRILLVKTKKYFFIAPDNGLLSMVLEEEKVKKIREVANKKYFLEFSSRTFEGRDKMAPVAAWLSKGIQSREFGPEISSFEKLKIEKAQIKGNEVIGRVLYIDKFGNLITNMNAEMLDLLSQKTSKKKFFLKIKGRDIFSFVNSYSEAKKGKLIFLVGSTGMIEIASREDNASQKLKAKVGEEVRIAVRV